MGGSRRPGRHAAAVFDHHPLPKEGYFRVLADAHDPRRGLTVRDGFGVELTQLGATTTFGPMTEEPELLKEKITPLPSPTPPSNSQSSPAGAIATAPVQAQGRWEIIAIESFEGDFPSAGWTVKDLSSDGYERYWDDDDYRSRFGNRAAWPARGGTDGRDPTPGNDNYFNSMDTRMIYGPFDLVALQGRPDHRPGARCGAEPV